MIKTTWSGALLVVLAAVGAGAEERPRLIAHRGGSHEADENTMGAFRRAYEHGLRGFETDIRMTRDDQLVILHDNALDRTTTGHGPVESATAADVRAARTKKAGEPVPFLADFLAYFRDKPDVFIELEMKTNPTTYSDERLEAFCRKLHDAVKGQLPDACYSFTSFDKRALKVMRRIDPAASLTMIVDGGLDETQVKLALELGCKRISPIIDVTTRKAVRVARKAGLEVTVWPATSEKDLALAQALDADCLTTDIPIRLHTGRRQDQLR